MLFVETGIDGYFVGFGFEFAEVDSVVAVWRDFMSFFDDRRQILDDAVDHAFFQGFFRGEFLPEQGHISIGFVVDMLTLDNFVHTWWKGQSNIHFIAGKDAFFDNHDMIMSKGKHAPSGNRCTCNYRDRGNGQAQEPAEEGDELKNEESNFILMGETGHILQVEACAEQVLVEGNRHQATISIRGFDLIQCFVYIPHELMAEGVGLFVQQQVEEIIFSLENYLLFQIFLTYFYQFSHFFKHIHQ